MLPFKPLSVTVITLFSVLCGCASVPQFTPKERMCQFTSYDLAVERPAGFADQSTGRQTLGAKLNEALKTPLADATVESRSMLFLSGGSLHGAFGAGFLADWKRASNGRLPEFKVVTGISTGAILATFAFLDQPERAVEGYTIETESDLLKPFGGVSNGQPTTSSYIALLKKGALADLGPLRDRLHRFVDDDVLRKVAAESAQRHRLLLIGVVDVDTGQAVVLDLTQMATQYVEAGDDPAQELKRDCYIEGIVASSSAPLAALPVFLDNRMYVDGGVRFGVFSDEIGEKIEPVLADAARPTIYVLINGDQEIAAKCGKADPAEHCADGTDPAGNYPGEHAKWSFPDLALRSEGILVNQVYRFSEFAIAKGAAERKYSYHSIKIEDDLLRHRYPRGADGQPTPGAKLCSEWKQEDIADGRAINKEPLQFFPKYMQCVIDYGRYRVPLEMKDWNDRSDGLATENPFDN